MTGNLNVQVEETVTTVGAANAMTGVGVKEHEILSTTTKLVDVNEISETPDKTDRMQPERTFTLADALAELGDGGGCELLWICFVSPL